MDSRKEHFFGRICEKYLKTRWVLENYRMIKEQLQYVPAYYTAQFSQVQEKLRRHKNSAPFALRTI